MLAAYRSQDVAVLWAGLGLEAGAAPVLDDDGSGRQTRLVSNKRLKNGGGTSVHVLERREAAGGKRQALQPSYH